MTLVTGKITSSRFDRGGFTLVETLVTVVIMATCLVGVLRAFQTSLIALSGAKDSIKADALITEKLAEIERAAMKGDQLDEMTGGFVGPDGVFSGQVQITSVNNIPGASLYKVSILLEHVASHRKYGASTLITCLSDM